MSRTSRGRSSSSAPTPPSSIPFSAAMIRQAVLRRGVKLVVADPRKIDIAEFATLHLRHRPGTDVALLNGLMHIILATAGTIRRSSTRAARGSRNFASHVDAVPARASRRRSRECRPSNLHAAAEILATNQPMAVIWAMGITQHTTGVLNVLALGNLQMLLGNMGVPGGGVNPLARPEQRAGRLRHGGAAQCVSRLPAGDGCSNAGRSSMPRWSVGPLATRRSVPQPQLAATPGLTVTEMIAAAGAGTLRALYIVGEDPAMTDPDSQPCATVPGRRRVRRPAGDLSLETSAICRRAAVPALRLPKRPAHSPTPNGACNLSAGHRAAWRGAARLADHRRTGPRMLAIEGRAARGAARRLGLRSSGANHGRDRGADALVRRRQPRATGSRRAAAMAGRG